MNRYFIEATGPFTYNRTGVYYPYSQPVNFGAMLKKHGIVSRPSWARKYGEAGQNKVLCFTFTTELQPNAFGDDLPYGLRIAKRNWR